MADDHAQDPIDFSPALGMETPAAAPAASPTAAAGAVPAVPPAPAGSPAPSINFTPAWGPGATGSWPSQKEQEQEQPKSVLGFAGNILSSAGNFVGNVLHAARHPIDTSNSLFDLFYGSGRLARRELFDPGMPEDHSEQVVRNFRQYVGNRYGSPDKAWETFYHDPVGFMADASGALNLAGGAAKLAGTVGEVDALTSAGRAATTAGNVANPASWITAGPGALIGKLAPKPLAAFDPGSATFEGEAGAFDPKTGTFENVPVYRTPPTAPPKDPVIQLREEWGIKPPKSGLQAPGTPPAAPPAPSPAATAANAVPSAISKYLTGTGLSLAAAEALTHHLVGAAGTTLAVGAIKYLPMFLKSSEGQQMLAAIGPGSKPAILAGVANRLVPRLNALYKSQQLQEMQQPITIDPRRVQQLEPLPMQPFVRARGGAVSPELVRIQRDRLRLPGIVETLAKSK